ncbi:MAG: hypothetical protein QOF63_1133 [Thermoanaerobaculia bacterium]|jgi:hypothetical protein|nr:hypothetical protein [Thermoanaerobaculia bacterium]MEA2414632.1 hypothetical protein [Thermoanaerobaculia bacterium]
MSTWFVIAAFIALAVLGWNLYRRLGADRIEKFMERRRTTARMVSRGEFVDGNRHLAVALAVTDSTFFYENSDMQASLDLQWVREIEYDTELATGLAVAGGKVLRLRCDSQTFEFVLPNDVVARWHMMMPPRRVVVPAVA